MKWRYFKSREGLIVILWYMVIQLSLSSIPYTSITVIWNAVLVTIFFLYPVFGMVADIRFGRVKVMTIGTWITWVGAVSVAFYSASIEYVVSVPLITLLQSVQQTGAGIFQANALQFGLDQLQDASSEQLSTFVYWYIWSQEITGELLAWINEGTTYFIPSQTILVRMLMVVAFLSFTLCAIPCFLSRWNFVQPMVSNPYSLICQVLKFAWKHKYPLNRSAFTYWEEQKPSRIELGESKYGGPFTHEQIEDVKAFFKILKLLLLLTGFFICRNGFNIINVRFNSTHPQRLTMQGIVTTGVFTSLILHELIYPCFKARYPGALVRTCVGGVLSLLVLAAILLYDATGRVVNVVDGNNQYTLVLNPWFNLPTWLCGTLAYLIFTTSVLEFIVAQSPPSMRGMLIGIYYCIGYGLGQAVAWLLYLPFEGQDYTASFHNDVIYLVMMTTVGIVSIAMFIQSASKYKFREREEIVTHHIFAENYYGKETSI